MTRNGPEANHSRGSTRGQRICSAMSLTGPRSGDQSSVDLSVKAVGRDLLSDAAQHPTTIVPGFVAALSLMGMVVLPELLVWEMILLIAAGATAAGSFGWRYWIKYSKEYARRVQELMDLQDGERRAAEKSELEDLRETLRSGFSTVGSSDGIKALDRLVGERHQLNALLQRSTESERTFVAQIPSLAEETYRQGLNVLANVLELLLATSSSDRRGLKAEVANLEREIQELRSDDAQSGRLRIREDTLLSVKERLDLVNQQDLRAEEFIYRSRLSEDALAKTRIELAALKAGSSETGVTAVREALQKTIDQAKEVQEELRRLGF